MTGEEESEHPDTGVTCNKCNSSRMVDVTTHGDLSRGKSVYVCLECGAEIEIANRDKEDKP